MRRALTFLCALSLTLVLALTACGARQEMADMESVTLDGLRAVIWEDRTYVPFCVVSRKDCGAWIGCVDGDRDDRISTYRDYPAEEWLVSWIPMDGGAMLLKEESVTDIPEGLTAEYPRPGE